MRLLVVWAFLFRYYALDSVKTEKDIEEINEMVRLNKHEKIELMPLKKRKGWKVLLVIIIAITVLSSLLMAAHVYLADSNIAAQYSVYCLNGFAVSLDASVVLLAVLAVYFVVYFSRRRMKSKLLTKLEQLFNQ